MSINVTYQANGNGTVYPTGVVSLASVGSSMSASATSNSPDTFINWTVVSGSAVILNPTYPVLVGSNNMALGDCTIQANFTDIYLKSWWKGEDDPTDSVGGNYAIWTSGSAYSTGVVGKCFAFSPTVGPLEILPDINNYLTGNSHFKISFYYKETWNGYGQFLFDRGGFSLFSDGTRLNISTGGGVIYYSFGMVNYGQWYLVDLEYIAGSFKLYLDGVLQTPSSSNIEYKLGVEASKLLPIYFGKDLSLSAVRSNIYIDEIKIRVYEEIAPTTSGNNPYTIIKRIFNPVLTNQRLSPYRHGTSDKIQFKVQILSGEKLKPIYISNIPLSLYLNYTGDWTLIVTGVTNKFGCCTFTYSCQDIPNIDFCLAKLNATIKNVTYTSNTSRINFTKSSSSIGGLIYKEGTYELIYKESTYELVYKE